MNVYRKAIFLLSIILVLSNCCCFDFLPWSSNEEEVQENSQEKKEGGQHKANEIDDPEVIKKKKEVEGFYNDFDKKYKDAITGFGKEDLIDEFIKKYKDDCNYNRFEEYVKNKIREYLKNMLKNFKDFFGDDYLENAVNELVDNLNNAAEAEKHMSKMVTDVYEFFNKKYGLENVINDQEKKDIINKMKALQFEKVKIENFIKELLQKKAEEMYKKICGGLKLNKKVAKDFSFTDEEKKEIIDKIIESKFDEKEVLGYIYDEIFKKKAETIYDEIYKNLEGKYNLEKDFFSYEKREGIIQYIINSCFNKGEIENYIEFEIKKEKAEKLYDKNKEAYGLNNLLKGEHDRILSKFIELNFDEGEIKNFLEKYTNEKAETIYDEIYKDFEKKYGNLKCIIGKKKKSEILKEIINLKFSKYKAKVRIEEILKKNKKELKDKEDTISTILKYGSCIVCKDTTSASYYINNNYDFDKKEYTYCYNEYDTYTSDKKNAAVITNKGVFNFRQAHICMSMLAKSSEEDDDKKISGTLYRSGVLGYILKHESGNPTYLIPDGFINNRRGDLCSNALSCFGGYGFPFYNFEYVKAEENYDNFIKKIDEKKNELEKKNKYNENQIKYFLYDDENFLDNLYKNGYITDEMKTSERMHLKFTEFPNNTHNNFNSENENECLFTNLSFLCAKDDEICYRLKDNFEDGGDDFPFEEMNFKETFKTKINFTPKKDNEGDPYFGYYDNLFFYKPSKNFFKNVCKTECLNYTTKVYDFKEKKVGNRYFVSENNEIPIVPISKIKNPGFNYNKKLNIAAYKIECIGMFMDIRTLKGLDYRDTKEYRFALKILEQKKQDYVIVLTDDRFVIDTVEHLSEFFNNVKGKDGGKSIGEFYNEKWINLDIGFNKDDKTKEAEKIYNDLNVKYYNILNDLINGNNDDEKKENFINKIITELAINKQQTEDFVIGELNKCNNDNVVFEKIYNYFDDLYFGLISCKKLAEYILAKVNKVKVDKNTIIEKFKELKFDKVQIEEYIEKEVIKDLIENNDVVDYIYDIFDEEYNNFYHIFDDEEKKNGIKEDFKEKCKCNKDKIEKYINDLLVSEVEKTYNEFVGIFKIEQNFFSEGEKNEIIEEIIKEIRFDTIKRVNVWGRVIILKKMYEKLSRECKLDDYFDKEKIEGIVNKEICGRNYVEAKEYMEKCKARKVYNDLEKQYEKKNNNLKYFFDNYDEEEIVKKIIDLKFNIEKIEEYIESEITKFKGQYEKLNEKYYLDGLSDCLDKGEKENFIKEIKSLFDGKKNDEEIENAIKEKIKSNKNIKIFAEKINSKINESYCGIFLNKENKLDSALTEKIENFGCVYSSVVDYAKGIIDSYNEKETDIAVGKAYNFINKRFCGIFNEGKKEENEKKDIVDFNNKIGEGTIKKKIKELKFDREEIGKYIKKELSSIDLDKNLIIANEISDRIYSYFDEEYGLNGLLNEDQSNELKEKVIGFVKEYIKNKTSDFYDEIKDYIEDHVI